MRAEIISRSCSAARRKHVDREVVGVRVIATDEIDFALHQVGDESQVARQPSSLAMTCHDHATVPAQVTIHARATWEDLAALLMTDVAGPPAQGQ